MAGEQLKQFMMGLGFQIDQAGMAKLEAFIKNTEAYAKQSAANIDKLVKTLEGYTKGLTRTTAEADKHKQSQDKQAQSAKEFCKQIEECTKGLFKSIEGLVKHTEEQNKDTKSTEGATNALTKHGEAHHRMREVWKLSKEAAFGFAGAVTALAITGEEMVRRVSKQFEQLFYLSQRTGVAGHSIEALRFQFKSIGLDAGVADQALTSMADRIADLPATLSIISARIGRPVKDAEEALRGLAEEYNRLLKTGSPADIAAFREFMRVMGQNENVIAQYGRNIQAANEAVELHHKILHDLGFGDGKVAAEALQKRSVEFRKAWVGTQEVLGKIAENFAGALMPGITRFLNTMLGSGGVGDVNEVFKELCTRFDNFVRDIIGKNGEKAREFFRELRDDLVKLKDVFLWLEEHIGLIPTLLLAAFTPSIAKGLVAGVASSIVSGFAGLGASAAGAFRAGFLAKLSFYALIAEAGFNTVKQWQKGPEQREKERADVLGPRPWWAPNIDPMDLIQRLLGGGKKEEVAPVGHAAGGIVGINAHAGEAVLPVSLTNMLLRAANQPQPFNAARGQDSVTEVLDRLANDFNQWWSGSASFGPLVVLAEEVYQKLSSMLHELLEDFGFEQKGRGTGPGASQGSGAAGSGEGESQTRRGPGGRFKGMGPGGGTTSEEGTQTAPPGAEGQYRPKYKLTEADLTEKVINTIAGEATGTQESTDAVINNMFNRLGTKGYGKSGNLHEVASAPGQYAGYKVASAERAAQIRARIEAIASGSVPDATGGANEFRSGSYTGPWAQRHANAPVIGGNRFAYNPAGGRSPYAPYKPGEGPSAGVPESSGGRVKELQSKMAAIRKLPLAAQLKAQLEYAAEQAQVVAEVFSGGQHEYGQEGVDRTGSHRHDKGEAGDVQLRDPKTGKLLDMRNPDDQDRMAQFVRSSVAAGVTGVGGAEGYMGAHGLHVGGGTAGTWGASTRFGTAPKWLSDAYQQGVADRANMRSKLGTDNRQMQRNLGTEKPAWREERRADAGDYGGGGDQREVVHKSETTINVVGAADPHGTGETVRRLQDRNSPLQMRGRRSALA